MRKWINKAVAAFMMLWFPAFTVLASDDWSDFDEDLPSIYTEEETSHSTETEAASESDDYSADTYSETEPAATEEDSAYGTDTESAYTAEEPAYGETESAATEEDSAYGTDTESAYTAEEPAYGETESAATEEDSAYGTDTESAYTAEEPAYGETESAATEEEPAYDSESTPGYGEDSSYSTESVAQEPAYDSESEDASVEDNFGSSGAFDYVKIKRNEKKGESQFQNAIIEGVQVTTEEGASSDEKVITCYFIFRDNPSNYFYEVDHKNKQLVFEFNDTRTGSSPVTTIKEDPITGFEIEETQVDANAEIEGLNPEWHDQIQVTFNLEKIPIFTVSDDQDIISFKYKWTTDPEKVANYVQKDRFPTVFLWSGVGLGSLGVGLLSYFLLKKPPEPFNDPTLSRDDLPVRTAE